MASSNNPTTTQPAATVTTPPPATPTTVTITQSDNMQLSVDLHDLSAADAAKLYDSLGKIGTTPSHTNYQQLADQVAGFAKNFKSIISVQLPPNMDYQKAMKSFLKALQDGGGKVKDGSDQYLKAMEGTELGQSIEQSGLWRTGAGAVAAVDATGQFISGLSKPIEGGSALTSAVTGTLSDVGGQIGFGMSDEQAKAVGTAYAAALYSKVDAPGVKHDANLLDKAVAGGEWAFGSVWHLLPPSISAFFVAIGKWVTNGFDWSKAYGEAMTEQTAAHSAPALTYEQTLERNLKDSADKSSRPEAADLLRQAQKVDGVDTAPIADIVTQGGIYRDRDGTYNTLQFTNGAPATAVMKDENDKPITLSQRNSNRWHAVADAIVPHSAPQALGEAASAAAIYHFRDPLMVPVRAMWNLGAKVTLGSARVGTDLVLGGISGVTQTASKIVGVVVPSSAGANAHLSKNVDIVDAAGNKAAKAATKLGKQQHLEGDALKNVVEEAREAARSKAAEALKPRSAFSKMFDFARPYGDAVREFGTKTEASLVGASAWVRESLASVKETITVDIRTAASKAKAAEKAEAKLTAEAAMGKVSQESIDAAKAAHDASISGKAGAFVSRMASHVKLPKWLGGGDGAKVLEEGAEVVEKIAPKAGKIFKFAKVIPLVGVAVVYADQAFASPLHADTVNGTKLGFREQLLKDYITGRISYTKFEVYKNLQDHFALTGLGGIITAGVVEVGQDSISQLDKASMARYLPETALDMFREKHIPDLAPQAAATLLTPSERMQRIQQVQQEAKDNLTRIKVSPVDLRGSMDGTVNWQRVLFAVGQVPAAPEKAAPAPAAAAKPAALTPKELHAAHEGVIEQARMAVGRTFTDVEKMLGFNVGTGFSSVSKTSIGGFASNAQTGTTQQTAAHHVANA